VTPEAHAAFTAALLARLAGEADVIGLVVLGSGSGIPPGPDAFSDHDFFVVTVAGEQERFRTDLAWLPDAAEVALSFRETAHGVKALYASGHLAEFAVFDAGELALARVNRYRVLLDRADVAARMARVRAATAAGVEAPDPRWRVGQFLTQLVVGAGRAARGERLSGHQLVRDYALGNLLHLLRAKLAPGDAARLDDLDVNRRFERVLPELGRALDAALREPVMGTARALLALAARELPELVSARARAAVEAALSQADANRQDARDATRPE
jgi:hypothetical protein